MILRTLACFIYGLFLFIISALEEHPDFNKQGIILDTIEKGVNYPVIHILRITEDEEDEKAGAADGKPKSNNAKNPSMTITVTLAKPLSLNEPKSVAFVEGCDDVHPDRSAVCLQKNQLFVYLLCIFPGTGMSN